MPNTFDNFLSNILPMNCNIKGQLSQSDGLFTSFCLPLSLIWATRQILTEYIKVIFFYEGIS